MEQIAGGRAQVPWMFGKKFSVWMQRATKACATLPVRVLLAVAMFFVATQAAFAQCLTLAWRLHWAWYLAWAGGMTPGDDFRRFIPLMEFVPVWYVAGGLAAALLILIAILELLRGRRAGFGFYVAGLFLSLSIEWLVTQLPGFAAAASRVYDFQVAHAMRDWVIPVAGKLFPLGLGFFVWLSARSRPRSAV